MNAKEYLKKVSNGKAIINAKMEEIKRLQYLSTKISTLHEASGVGKKIAKLESEIYTDMEEFLDLENNVKKTISEISDFEERTLIEFRYFNMYRFEKIAMLMSCSSATIFRIHKKALASLDHILEEKKG